MCMAVLPAWMNSYQMCALNPGPLAYSTYTLPLNYTHSLIMDYFILLSGARPSSFHYVMHFIYYATSILFFFSVQEYIFRYFFIISKYNVF
jgi:bacteriorhodopsin